ncbi:hypothetical protein G6F43_010950 [Rhizopus delemar]|nr:hypothetical protein G6F43_010950 [Rhizopus delemar]
MSATSAQFYLANVFDFKTMKVDKAIWEVELKKLEDSTCVHWTNKGFKIKEIVSSNTTESSSIGRNKTILWNEGAEKRNKMCHYDDVYNIWLSVAKDMFKFKENGFESLKVWEGKLTATNYKVLSYAMENTFYYGIISPWQMSIMEVSKRFSSDSNFGIASRSSEVLYSLIVRHPDTGKGVPVGYMITNDQSITVDCGIPKSDAIRVTFGENCRIQLCLFHVSQCWSRNLATQVMNSPRQHSNAKVVRDNTMSDLQSIMYETSCETVVEKSAAYVIEEHQNMSISNYIESWHNPLKSVYLKRTKNRRLDRLVYILVNEVENDMKFEEARVSSEVGRMGPETRNKRKRETVAADIPDDRTKELITKESETTYNVESFSQEDIMYTVQINETGNIVSCSCSYFKFNSRAFKNVSRMETVLSELDASSIPKDELLAPTAENDSNINATYILKIDIK